MSPKHIVNVGEFRVENGDTAEQRIDLVHLFDVGDTLNEFGSRGV